MQGPIGPLSVGLGYSSSETLGVMLSITKTKSFAKLFMSRLPFRKGAAASGSFKLWAFVYGTATTTTGVPLSPVVLCEH